MRLTFRKTPRTFNLVCLGYRGVGKTVFLASSYAELLSKRKNSNSQQLWFECQDNQSRNILENLLQSIGKTGKYPPPTIKITNFNFIVKHHGLLRDQTLCQFRWWDLPGEFCYLNNSGFQSIVLNSHGCCVFIDANKLLSNTTYLATLENLIAQIEAIASLVQSHGLKYAFALILTKCDLLNQGPLSLVKLEKNLQPLTTRLETAQAIYQTFYSAVPIITIGETAALQAQGAAVPLLWLTSKLRRLHHFQPPQALATGFKQILTNSTKPTSALKETAELNLTLPRLGQRLILSLIAFCLLGGLTVWGFGLLTPTPKQTQVPDQQIRSYKKVLQREPNNIEALRHLVTLYTDLGQFSQAIPSLKNLIQLEPSNLDLRFELAGLFALTEQREKEEQVYDDILSQQHDNLIALTSKARLRLDKGDPQTARRLFEQAANSAPNDALKAQVEEIAQNAFQSSTNQR